MSFRVKVARRDALAPMDPGVVMGEYTRTSDAVSLARDFSRRAEANGWECHEQAACQWHMHKLLAGVPVDMVLFIEADDQHSYFNSLQYRQTAHQDPGGQPVWQELLKGYAE